MSYNTIQQDFDVSGSVSFEGSLLDMPFLGCALPPDDMWAKHLVDPDAWDDTGECGLQIVCAFKKKNDRGERSPAVSKEQAIQLLQDSFDLHYPGEARGLRHTETLPNEARLLSMFLRCIFGCSLAMASRFGL